MLHGTIPHGGHRSEDIRIRELLARVGQEDIHEVIWRPILISKARRRQAILRVCSPMGDLWSRESPTVCLSAAIWSIPTRSRLPKQWKAVQRCDFFVVNTTKKRPSDRALFDEEEKERETPYTGNFCASPCALRRFCVRR